MLLQINQNIQANTINTAQINEQLQSNIEVKYERIHQ